MPNGSRATLPGAAPPAGEPPTDRRRASGRRTPDPIAAAPPAADRHRTARAAYDARIAQMFDGPAVPVAVPDREKDAA